MDNISDFTLRTTKDKTKDKMDTRQDLETNRKNGAEERRERNLQYNSPAVQEKSNNLFHIYQPSDSCNKEAWVYQNNDSYHIFKPTFESNHRLDKHFTTYRPTKQVSDCSECFLEKQYQKINRSFIWSINPRKTQNQISNNQSATCERFESFSPKSSPPLSESGIDATDRGLEAWQLLGNQFIDASSSNKSKSSDQYSHKISKEKKKVATLPKLQDVPHQLQDKLKEILYEITFGDLWLYDEEHKEFFAKYYGVHDICPLYVDHHGFSLWMLDKNKRLLCWNEMEGSITYLGSNLTEGFTNYLIHPERLCYITEEDFKLVPIDEFERQIDEMSANFRLNLVPLELDLSDALVNQRLVGETILK
ncbi:11371_t:CDS:2 [Funneliformis geosporum]|nr:11371_t:CDS:2 [Funneliformis geosporum]